MATIWFDVTTLVHWNRPPVGVVRVEAECFRFLNTLALPHVRYCHFDKNGPGYLELRAADVFARLERLGQAAPVAPPESSMPTATRASQRARHALERLPPGARAPLRELTRKATPLLRTALHHYRKASATVSELGQQVTEFSAALRASAGSAPSSGPASFERGDVFVSAGLDWDEQDSQLLYGLKRRLGLKVVLFCYDLIPVLHPHLCVPEVARAFPRYLVDVAWCADEVVCISKSTERDLIAFLNETGAPRPTTRVVHLGSDLTPPAMQHDVPLVSEPFLLFVSTLERRKNHEVIYRAMLELLLRGRTDLPLIVFVGMKGWGVGDFLNDLRCDPRVKGRFVVLDHVTDAQLHQLYARALFTLYPSLYEGWGLPLAESLAHGKFALAADNSSLPEVGGALVEYLDPWDHRQWADRIEHHLDHPEQLAARERAIAESYRVTTWAQTGEAVLEIARALLSAGER